jgi:hypothetical protein
MRAAALLLALAACARAPVEPTPAPAQCAADQALVRAFAGQVYTAELGAAMQRRAGAARLRAVRPDSVVTMDFRTDRLNVQLDAAGRVTGARCG